MAGNEQRCETEAEGTMGDEGHVHEPVSLHQTLNHPIAGITVSLRRRHRVSGDCTKLLVGIAQGCGRFRNLHAHAGSQRRGPSQIDGSRSFLMDTTYTLPNHLDVPEEMVIVSPIAAPTQVRRTPKRRRLSFLHRGLVVVASMSLIVGYQFHSN